MSRMARKTNGLLVNNEQAMNLKKYLKNTFRGYTRMTSLCIICIISWSVLSSFSSPGIGIKFYVEITTDNDSIVIGYLFDRFSHKPPEFPSDSEFSIWFNQNSPGEFYRVYKYVKEIRSIGTISSNMIELPKAGIKSLKLLSTDYGSIDLLLEEQHFLLITDSSKVVSFIPPEPYDTGGFCTSLLISLNPNVSIQALQSMATEIKTGLSKFLERDKKNQVSPQINEERDRIRAIMLKQDVLFNDICGP